MNPVDFPVFGNEMDNMDDINKVQRSLLWSIDTTSEYTKLYLTGGRVTIHNSLIEIANTVQCVILPLLTGYNKRTKVFRK